MDPRMIPRGSSPEYTYGEQDGRPVGSKPGVYFHPQAGAFVETAGIKRQDGSTAYYDGTGAIQGDAFRQLGYRPATEEELKEYRAKQEAAEKERKIAESRTTTVLSSPAGK